MPATSTRLLDLCPDGSSPLYCQCSCTRLFVTVVLRSYAVMSEDPALLEDVSDDSEGEQNEAHADVSVRQFQRALVPVIHKQTVIWKPTDGTVKE